MITLYHYCCDCSARRITARGFLQPRGASLFRTDVVWLTDQAVPDRDGLGLTSKTLSCDRLDAQYVATVDPARVERWLESAVRRNLRFLDTSSFEDLHRPDTWWIATTPVFAIRNRAYVKP